MNILIIPEMIDIVPGRLHIGVPACPPRSNFAWVWHSGQVVEINSFQLSRTHVTNAQYRAFLADTGHPAPAWIDQSGFEGPTQPVVGVSWEDSMAFCAWLSGKTGKKFRLLGDAEWEYAARGGREKSIFPWGNALDPKFACFGGQALPRPVGSYAPNAYGLHDMIGNCWTWCADRFEDVSRGVKAVNKPTGRDTSDNRVLRGGSYMTCHYLNLRIAYRHEDPIDLKHESIGFRIAL